MKTGPKLTDRAKSRPEERGAALVAVMLFSLLLLAAGGALILTTAMTASSAAEATAEEQAYTAAEAGLQAALNVLRGNVAPNPLPTPNPSTGGVADLNKINYRRAAYRRDPGGATTVPSSNKPTDASADARLSRWLNYSADFPDRVALSNPYSLLNGMAYGIVVTDPTNSDKAAFYTQAEWSVDSSITGVLVNNAVEPREVTITVGTNVARIFYTPAAPIPNSAPLTTYPPVSSVLGSFRIELPTGSAGLVVPPGIKLKLMVRQTYPVAEDLVYVATLSGEVKASPASSTLKLTFDPPVKESRVTKFTLPSSFTILYIGGGSTTSDLTAIVAGLDPPELLVISTGYGPRGARKMLQMTVNKFAFDLAPPSPIVIRGADVPDGASSAPTMTFNLGSSNAKRYTGEDLSGLDPQRPTVAISLHDWTAAHDGISKGATVAAPQLSVLDLDPIPTPWPSTLTPIPSSSPQSAFTPSFLRTADATRNFLNYMEARARLEGRYFTTLSGMAGSATPYNPQLTFVDGNCTLDGGSGILIVTGTLTINGNDDFKGVILVLGGGTVYRGGGGNGNVQGAWYVAKFIRRPTGSDSRKFLAPVFDVSGGGNSTFQFSSRNVMDANNLTGNSVAGVVEF